MEDVVDAPGPARTSPDATRRRWFENLGEGAYAGVTEVVFEGP